MANNEAEAFLKWYLPEPEDDYKPKAILGLLVAGGLVTTVSFEFIFIWKNDDFWPRPLAERTRIGKASYYIEWFLSALLVPPISAFGLVALLVGVVALLPVHLQLRIHNMSDPRFKEVEG